VGIVFGVFSLERNSPINEVNPERPIHELQRNSPYVTEFGILGIFAWKFARRARKERGGLLVLSRPSSNNARRQNPMPSPQAFLTKQAFKPTAIPSTLQEIS
jgi:hypothetical protein